MTPVELVIPNPSLNPPSNASKLLPSHTSQNNEETKTPALSLIKENDTKDDEKEQEDMSEKDTMSVDNQNTTQEECDEVIVIKVKRNQKTNRNCCVPFEDQKQWCAQGQGTLIHILQLKSPQVTLCGM